IDTLTIESEHTPSLLRATHTSGLIFRFIPVDSRAFYHQLLVSTGSEEHLRQLDELLAGSQLPELDSEEAIYTSIGLAYIQPELREGTNEIPLAKDNSLPALISYTDLRGTLHNHSTYSDGVNTLEEMARYCRDE